jgi:hypothetical protein
MNDNVNSPQHYKQNKGWEAIDVTEQFNFNLGNALKYVIRCDHKGKPVEDLQKAIWYIQREISRRSEKEGSRQWPDSHAT